MRPIDTLREKIDLWKKSTTDTALMSVLHDVLQQIDVAIYEMDHKETESPWHRVEEPPSTDEYVHAFDGGFVGMASFDGEKWWQHDTYESFIISPSHWMPHIPDPKEEEK